MKLVYEDKKKRIIKNQDEIKFSSASLYYLIILTARAKGEKQISDYSTDDEDLTVQIDNKIFPKLGTTRQVDSPAAINGGRIHNLSKTVYFLTYLEGKDHKLILKADDPPSTATFESLEIYTLDSTGRLTLEPKIQAEDGDRRPWVTFVLDNIPLQDVAVTTTYSRRKRDSDDVKVKIDSQTQENLLRNIKHFLWYFAGSLIPIISPTRTETQVFTTNLFQGLHYIELDADRMPTLEKITFNFSSKLPTQKNIPTVDNPKWTGSFDDDTDEMLLARLIFGEAEDQPKEAKIGVGFTVFNRIKKQQAHWGFNLREVILKEFQYDSLWNRDRKEKVINPLLESDEATKQAWLDSYKVAQELLVGSVKDPTNGATHFHSYKRLQDFPSWAIEKNFKVKVGKMYFYELEK